MDKQDFSTIEEIENSLVGLPKGWYLIKGNVFYVSDQELSDSQRVWLEFLNVALWPLWALIGVSYLLYEKVRKLS